MKLSTKGKKNTDLNRAGRVGGRLARVGSDSWDLSDELKAVREVVFRWWNVTWY